MEYIYSTYFILQYILSNVLKFSFPPLTVTDRNNYNTRRAAKGVAPWAHVD